MWRFLAALVITSGYIWILNHPLQVGGNTLPPLGSFFSASEGFWQNADGTPGRYVTIENPRLTEAVIIRTNERLVPHIFASNASDLYFAQGYVTAMYRLWQMDISTRAAGGRVAEILGERLLDYDKGQRNMGMLYAAENSLRRWEQDPHAIELLRAYSDGISAYIKTLKRRDYPLEFKLLNYSPEEWSPLKSALFVKSMANTLCSQEYDFRYSNLYALLGPDRFAFLFPEYNPAQDPVIPPGTPWDFNPVSPDPALKVVPYYRDTAQALINATRPESEVDYGSNNWALAGTRTASGHPILCNDPHLTLSLPSIWFEIQLSSPGNTCYGASLPGVPGVIVGFNERIAWGATNVGHDVLDIFHIEWTDEPQGKYLAGGEVMQATTRIEEFRLPKGETVYDTVTYTIWGPVIKTGPMKGMAMKWLPHETPSQVDATVFLDLNRARNLPDFLAALDRYHTPAQNFVYADVDGNIALRIGGALPLRPEGSGRFVTDGNESVDTWTSTIPPHHNPVTINPDRGFVSSANQRTTDNTYPYYYTGGHYFEDYRGRTLNTRLSGMLKATVEDNQHLQHSTYSLKAAEILPLLLSEIDSVSLDDKGEDVAEALAGWNYEYDESDDAPTYFEIWFAIFYRQAWADIIARTDSIYLALPDSWRTIELARNAQDSIAFDNPSTIEVETFGSLARSSFTMALDSIKSIPPSDVEWGRYRHTTIQHLANLPGMSRTLVGAPGHGDALNATGRREGPSWRMVVELTTPVTGYVVYPGGQSGNPGSPFYDNMIDDWLNGTYYRVSCAENPEEVDYIQLIELKPAGR